MENWVHREPTANLWLAVVTALLFGVTFARSRSDDERAWVWGRRLIESLVRALVFAALPGMFYFLLNSNYAAFSQACGSFTTGGSLSNRTWQQWRDFYGGDHTQRDLLVTQYVVVETQKVIQPTDPSAPPLYRNVKVEQPISQNSIVGFRGRVTMNLVDPAHQTDTFNAYTLSALYEYDIVNPVDTETRVEFSFPLSSGAKLYQDISVKVNGKKVSSWRVLSGAITWDEQMSPGEKNVVSIHYVTRGMNGFTFEIPEPREVTNFELTVALDTHNYWPLTEPDNSGVQLDVRTKDSYDFITWTIERSIISPRLSVYTREGWPYAPYHEMIVTLPYAARASILFLSLAALTLLICGAPVSLRQVALLACLFAIPHLILMSGGVPAPKSITPAQFADYQVKMLPVISILPLVLAFITLRKLTRLPLVLTLALMALFMAGYPFVGLLPDEQKRNAFEGMVQVAMIAYVFALTLYVRVRSTFQRKA